MRSTFTLDCRFDNRNIKHIGNVYCPITMCSGIFCVHKNAFHSSAEATINVLSARLRVMCAFSPLMNEVVFLEVFSRDLYF